MEYDSYKRLFAWVDVYSGTDMYGYDETGVSRDDFNARATVPDYYKKSS
jgi:hypothetical protein